jgi:hypothetical protein
MTITGQNPLATMPGECHMVQTVNFRCLAFRETDGTWRNAYCPEDPPLVVVRVEDQSLEAAA